MIYESVGRHTLCCKEKTHIIKVILHRDSVINDFNVRNKFFPDSYVANSFSSF